MSAVLPRAVGRLIEALSRLPGIGPKTASRLTYHLLRASEGESLELAEALRSMRAETKLCSVCFNITDRVVDPCGVCRDDSRRSDLICVVESPLDVLALERTESFRGRYHVLHGAISPVEGIGPEDLKLAELVARVAAGGVDEVTLATNPALEGVAAAMCLRRRLEAYPWGVARLARGLPAGGDLEYADASTLSQALDGRREMP